MAIQVSPAVSAQAAIGKTQTSIARDEKDTAKRAIFFIGIALFVSTFCQTGQVGRLPINFILKDRFALNAAQMSFYIAIIMFPWYMKPFAGIITDCIPLWGSRRRNYILLSSLAAAVGWILMTAATARFGMLIAVGILLNCVIMWSNVVTGGLLVFEGRRLNITGQLASARVIVKQLAMIIAGPIGGYLAAQALGWTAVTCACLFTILAILAGAILQEEKVSRPKAPWLAIIENLRQTAGSRSVWLTAMMVFLFQIQPGFATPLFYYQTQTLHFESPMIGILGMASASSALLTAIVYSRVCRQLDLKTLLFLAVLIHAVSVLAYLRYDSRMTALAIELIGGVGTGLAQLPLFDLAARATSKGNESLSYALMMSVWNLGMSVSDILGSSLYDHFGLSFRSMVGMNSGSTLVCLFLIPLVPAELLRVKAQKLNL